MHSFSRQETKCIKFNKITNLKHDRFFKDEIQVFTNELLKLLLGVSV